MRVDMFKANLISCSGLMLLCAGAHSLQAELISYEELKSAYDSGISARIILNLTECKTIQPQTVSYSVKNVTAPLHEHDFENDSVRTRFNIDRAMLRSVDNVEALYIIDSYRVPHTPRANDTSIGPLYDVATSIQLYASQEVRYFLKAQSLDQSETIESIFSCPWSSLTINIGN